MKKGQFHHLHAPSVMPKTRYFKIYSLNEKFFKFGYIMEGSIFFKYMEYKSHNAHLGENNHLFIKGTESSKATLLLQNSVHS